MKTYIGKIITLILTLTLVFGSTLSLSSCSYTLGILGDALDNVGGDGEGDGGDGGENLTAQRAGFLSSVAIIANFGSSSSTPRTQAGSGVIYKLDKATGDAYIITNYHVVYYDNGIGTISNDIEVYLYGLVAEPYAIEATYLGGSMNYDLAVLKVSDSYLLKEEPVTAATVSDSELLRALDPVIAIGNAEGEGFSATKGSVSVPSEYLTMTGPNGYTDITVRVIRVDTAINEGNSGGGLFNAEGKLVGIVNAKKIGEKVDNIAYAIPINLAVAVAENIIFHDTASPRGFCRYLLGITISEAELSLDVDENGEIVRTARVAITEVQNNSPIYHFVKEGDTIHKITVAGKETAVTAVHHVTESMLWARPDDVVTLVIERDGKFHIATLTVSSGIGVTE